MSSSITLPTWLVVVVAILAIVAAINHFFLPGIRWFLRRRVNKVISDVNDRLRLKLPTFQLTKRRVLIDRLTYDPEVMKAVAIAADERGVPREGVMAEVLTYAREIVPAFNAFFYFRIGYRLARWFLRSIYHVRLGFAHEGALAAVPPDTSVVFFINHRSNMDYLLVTYLASGSAALSYGAGEWARVWPFRAMLRMAGAYILRRDTSDPLYRIVLQRYVQMATEAGVPHAIFGEGKLSRNGLVNSPKLGLLGYICKVFDPDGPLDIMLVPVATNFDRIVEERTLVTNVDTDFRGRGALFILGSSSKFVLQYVWGKLTGREKGFGVACANFGEPLSLRAWSRDNGAAFCELDKPSFHDAVAKLASELTDRVIDVMPITAVPLVSMTLLDAKVSPTLTELKCRSLQKAREFGALGAHIAMQEGEEEAAIDAAIAMLRGRQLILVNDRDVVSPVPEERNLLEYYANSIAQLRTKLLQG
ncbi:MAG: 1-acyl-sn-glycerol-3-phosphate acyltransferase [Hyphomicrobiaceae bacterium]